MSLEKQISDHPPPGYAPCMNYSPFVYAPGLNYPVPGHAPDIYQPIINNTLLGTFDSWISPLKLNLQEERKEARVDDIIKIENTSLSDDENVHHRPSFLPPPKAGHNSHRSGRPTVPH